MPRAAEILRLRGRIGAFTHGIGAFIGGNTGSGVNMVDRNRKSRFVIIGIVGNHSAELQFIHNLRVGRHANQAAGVFCHKVYVVAGAELRCHNKVAFIFAVFVVRNQNHFAVFYGFNGFFNSIKLKIIHNCLLLYKTIFKKK